MSRSPLPRTPTRGASIAALALGIVLLIDVLRVWMPSVIFVYGRAGSTPATEMGLFAAVPFLLAVVAAVALRWVGAPRLVLVGAAVAVLARLGLQATGGGDPQLWLSTVAVTALLVWLLATAGMVGGGVAALGAVTGMAADATLHTVLRSIGLTWRGGVLGWAGVLLLVVAFAVAQSRASGEAAAPRGPALGWLGLSVALVVHAIVSAPVSRVHAVTGWPEWAAAAVLVAGHVLAVLVAVRLVGGGRVRGGRGGRGGLDALDGLGGLLGVGALVALGLVLLGGPVLVAVGHLLLPAFLAAAVTSGLLAGRRGPAGRALAAAGGLLLFFALTFGFYASYDMVLPFPNDVMPALAAVVAVAVGLAGLRGSRGSDPVALPADGVVAGVLGLVLLASVGVVAVAADSLAADPGEGFPLRVFNYNLQMGFDIVGDHAVIRQAELVAEQQPDIVALQEVSRGWLLNASTDTLPAIAERLGMPWVFAPAADRAWGNAILSRYPVLDSGHELLPRLDSAMQRSVVWAVLDVAGEEVAVVVTHLQHVAGQTDVRRAQAEVVARVVDEQVSAGRSVILMGDFNAPPGADELASFDDRLIEVSGADGPIATYPAWGAERHIDHIYVTPDLAASDVVVPESTASDHLGVGVTLDRP